MWSKISDSKLVRICSRNEKELQGRWWSACNMTMTWLLNVLLSELCYFLGSGSGFTAPKVLM